MPKSRLKVLHHLRVPLYFETLDSRRGFAFRYGYATMGFNIKGGVYCDFIRVPALSFGKAWKEDPNIFEIFEILNDSMGTDIRAIMRFTE